MALKTYNFKVVVERDQDFDRKRSGWHAYCPALESLGGSTWGETREEALKHINEVVQMIIQEFVADGMALPEGLPK
jgi:predicted RNase H-like HicB family nuclease